jgi:hypothetical protein
MPWRQGETLKPPAGRRLRFRVMKALANGFLRTPAPTRRVDDAEVITLARRVLPTITPHISGLVAGADPLTAFFASLEKVAALDGVTLALPAHGHPFTDLSGRAADIRQHHEERLDTLRAAAGELGSATVQELSKRLFRERSWGPMAESETFAHLEHLRAVGQAESRREGSDLLYQLTE